MTVLVSSIVLKFSIPLFSHGAASIPTYPLYLTFLQHMCKNDIPWLQSLLAEMGPVFSAAASAAALLCV